MNALQLQMNDIPVPDDLDSFIKKSMKKYSVRKFNKRVFICLTAVITLFAALTITCYASPKAAEALSKMPVIGSMFNRFTDKDLIAAHNNGLTQVLNQQQSDGDVTITITELYCDQTDFSVGLSEEYNQNSELFYEVYYDGQLISGAGSRAAYSDMNKGKDKSKHEDFYLIDLPLKVVLPDKCNVELVAFEQDSLKRRFTFDIAMDTSIAKEQSTEIEINKTYTEGEQTLLVKKIVFSPYATTVYYNYTDPNDGGSDVQLLDSHNKALTFKSCFNDSINTQSTYRTESRVAVFGSMKKLPDSLTFQILQFNKNNPMDRPVLMSEEIQLDTQ